MTSRRPPSETKGHLTRSFDGFHGRDAYLESQMRGDVGGGVGSGRDVIRRRTPALYDPWNDDIVSSRNDGQRSLKYIHTTNYPNKLLMRRAKSVASLHSPNGSVNGSPNGFTPRYDGATSMTSDLKAPKVVLRTVDRQTQTTVDRYTQTPVVLAGNEYNTYYHQLLSSINSRSSSADFAVVNRPGEVRQLQSFVQKHGPAMYRDGGKGAPWRHLKMTCGVSGENIMFVDGAVKEYDSRFFPLPSARRRELEVPSVYLRRPMSVIQ